MRRPVAAAGAAPEDPDRRVSAVLRCLVIEALANLLVLALKLTVGIATGSLAILADALHSLTDVANNVIGVIAMRESARPADREHPYGHQKFEILAVFVLAVLLATVGIEIATRAIARGAPLPSTSGWTLGLMLGVLVVNVAITAWQRHWAKKLASPILAADATHTLADVLTTVVVILGWQFAARGWPWLDTLCALGVSAMIFWLAYGLFRNAVPVLVDAYAIEPEALTAAIARVPGVIDVPRVRSRWIGPARAVDVIVTVKPRLPTVESHAIADSIEALLERDFDAADVTVHVEPHEQD